MGFIDRYRRFAELTDEEVREEFRARADEQRRRDLERVEVLDLSATTHEELPHPAVAAAISFAGKRALNRAGDPLSGELRDLLAGLSGVERGNVAVGPGATGLIGALATAVLGPGDVLATPWPSYPVYPLAAAAAGADAVPLGPDRSPQAIATAVAAEPRTRMLVICNPNDPDGSLMNADELAQLRELLPKSVLLVIDEALADYAGAEHLKATARLSEDSSGVVLVRTMSKAWGLAGLRVGWLIGSEDSRELFSRMSPLLGVSGPSEAGAIAAIREAGDTPGRRAREARRELQRLQTTLLGTPIEVADSHANFAWIRIPGMSAEDLTVRLLAAGVRVMDGTSVGAPDHIRATLRGDSTATERLAEGLLAAASAAQAPSPAD